MKRFVWLISCVFLLGCVDEYDYASLDTVERLVIWGEINNEPGPYRVTISKTIAMSPEGIIGGKKIMNGALVIIKDNLGNQSVLKQKKIDGDYFTTDTSFRGIEGRGYHVEVKLNDGRAYRSTEEIIPASVPIQSLSSKFYRRDSINEYGLKQKKKGHLVLATVTDPSQSGNYYRWNWKGTTRIRIQHAEYECFGTVCFYCPFVPCARVGYRDEFPVKSTLYIGSDLLSNGSTYAIPLAFIEEVFPRFSGSFYYYFEVKQQAISPEFYQYLEKVKLQLQTGGTVDAPPSSIFGNMKSETDNNEEALGYFSAVSNTRKSFFIKRNYDIPPQFMTCLINVADVYCEKPDYWTVD